MISEISIYEKAAFPFELGGAAFFEQCADECIDIMGRAT